MQLRQHVLCTDVQSIQLELIKNSTEKSSFCSWLLQHNKWIFPLEFEISSGWVTNLLSTKHKTTSAHTSFCIHCVSQCTSGFVLSILSCVHKFSGWHPCCRNACRVYQKRYRRHQPARSWGRSLTVMPMLPHGQMAAEQSSATSQSLAYAPWWCYRFSCSRFF